MPSVAADVALHPAVQDLHDLALSEKIMEDVDASSPAPPTDAISPTEAIEQMLAKYSVGLPATFTRQPDSGAHPSPVVLLTGSTGGLGSYMLASMVENPAVVRIFTYNRPGRHGADIQSRHREMFEDRGLDMALLDSEKIVYLEGDAAAPRLGLPDDVYEEVRTPYHYPRFALLIYCSVQLHGYVTTVIHNAWRLSLVHPLSAFEPNIQATRNLIDFTPKRARFMFTSSISSAQTWDQTKGPFPEEVVCDPSVAVGNGYGER